ncbi:TPA: recombinase family protein, partial [Clostridium perfringens]|nr:recombinase family protein [Clostridium perfringens]
YKSYLKGQISKRAGAKCLGTNHVTFSNWIKRYENINNT